MRRISRPILALAALMAAPFLTAQPASAEVIYPWCLYDSRGGVNCGFVNWQQCMASKTANNDMCGLNGLYTRAHAAERPRKSKRNRQYR